MRHIAMSVLAAVFCACATVQPAAHANTTTEVVAYQVPLDVATSIADATTSAYNTFNPNIRGSDGRLIPNQLTTAPQVCEINLDDGTGETLTTPSAAVIKSATLTLAGAVRGSMVADGPNGTCTAKKPGLYRACFTVGAGTGANTGTQTVTIFEKIGAASAAEVGQAIKNVTITLTAQPWIPLSACGFVDVSASDAASTGNVVFDARATSSTGNMVVKQYNLSVWKVDENDPPAPGP